MSTEVTLQIESTGSEITESVGEAIGRALQGGEYIEITSDLGGGKTTLTRGITRGTGSQSHVASPTFTVSRVYNAPHFEIHHFDFYRLKDEVLIKHELEDLLHQEGIVVVTEWGGVVEGVAPQARLKVSIERTGENNRLITIKFPPELEYLVKDIK